MRVIALTVALTFTMSGVAMPSPAGSPVAADSVHLPFSIADLTIPAEYGTVRLGPEADGDRGKSGSPSSSIPYSSSRSIILIQDAHAVNDAQENIRRIIDHLQSRQMADLVLLEGAKGKLDPVLLRTYPDARRRTKVASEYLERAELTGAEAAAVLNNAEGSFEGLEDWPLYSENFFAYQAAQDEKSDIHRKLAVFRTELDRKSSLKISASLREFLKYWSDFRSERISLMDLLFYLQRFATLGKKDAGYDELSRLLDSLGYEKSGAGQALEPAVRRIAEEFKSKFTRGLNARDQTNFIMNYQRFMTGQMSAGEMLSYLVRFGAERGHQLKMTPEIRRLLGHSQTLSEIKGSRLFNELNRFLPEAAESLVRSHEELGILRSYEKLFILESLASLELTHEMLLQYQREPEAYLGLTGDPELGKSLVPAIEFYQAALRRDLSFYEKVRRIPAEVRTVVLVAGGFHTNGLERLLRENGESYAVITPKIASLAGAENYFKVMAGDLSYKKYLKTTYYDALMNHAVRKLTESLSEPEFRQTVKLWRDNLIRDLSAKGRITDIGKYTRYLDELNIVYAERFAGELKPRSREDILDFVKVQLEKFKTEALRAARKRFEDQLAGVAPGLRQMTGEKEFGGAAATDRATFGTPLGLAPGNAVLRAEARGANVPEPVVPAAVPGLRTPRTGRELTMLSAVDDLMAKWQKELANDEKNRLGRAGLIRKRLTELERLKRIVNDKEKLTAYLCKFDSPSDLQVRVREGVISRPLPADVRFIYLDPEKWEHQILWELTGHERSVPEGIAWPLIWPDGSSTRFVIVNNREKPAFSEILIMAHELSHCRSNLPTAEMPYFFNRLLEGYQQQNEFETLVEWAELDSDFGRFVKKVLIGELPVGWGVWEWAVRTFSPGTSKEVRYGALRDVLQNVNGYSAEAAMADDVARQFSGGAALGKFFIEKDMSAIRNALGNERARLLERLFEGVKQTGLRGTSLESVTGLLIAIARELILIPDRVFPAGHVVSDEILERVILLLKVSGEAASSYPARPVTLDEASLKLFERMLFEGEIPSQDKQIEVSDRMSQALVAASRSESRAGEDGVVPAQTRGIQPGTARVRVWRKIANVFGKIRGVRVFSSADPAAIVESVAAHLRNWNPERSGKVLFVARMQGSVIQFALAPERPRFGILKLNMDHGSLALSLPRNEDDPEDHLEAWRYGYASGFLDFTDNTFVIVPDMHLKNLAATNTEKATELEKLMYVVNKIVSGSLKSAGKNPEEWNLPGEYPLIRSELRGALPAVKPLIYDKEKEEEFYELWGNQLKQSGNRDADALIEIARKLRRARQVIPYEEFSREMREVGPKLRDALEGRGQYAVIWGEPHTSRRWAWFHIKEGLREPAATVYENQIAEARSVSTFVIVDDASYSGTQIRETIEKIAKHNSRANIIVAVPYMTKRAHSVIRSRKGLPEGVSITVLDHKNMPTLSELLTEEENKLVDMKRKPQEEEDRASANRRFLGRVFMGGGSGKEYDIFKYATVTLFEHKIADSWSVYQRIAHFFDPVRPPYRDKESAYYQEESKQLADGNDGSARSSPAAKPPKEFGDAEKPRSEIRSGGDKGENPLEDSVAPPVFKEPTSRRTPQLARTELRTAGQLELFGPAELLPHGTARVRVDPQTVIELAASQIREGVERNIVKWDPEAGEYRVTGQNARDGLAAVRAAANRRDFSVGGQDVSREALIAGILTGNYIYREDREDIASGGGSVRYFTARPESRNVRRSEMRQKNIAEAQRQKLLDQALKTVVDRGLMTKVQVEQALKVSGIKWVGKKEGMERIGQLRKTDHGYLVELSMEWAQLPYQKEFRTAAKKARLSEAELLDLFENKLAYSLTRCLTQVSVEEFIHAFHLPKIFTRDGSLPSRTVIFLKETSLLRSRPEDAQKIFRFEKVVELLLAQREGSPLRELVERGNFHKKHVRYIEMLREITEEDFYGKTFLGEPLWLGRIGKFLDDIKGIYLTLSEKPQDSRPSGLPRRGLRDMGDFLEVLRIQRWHRNFVTHWLPVESSPHKDWTVNGTADLAGRKVPVIAKRKFSDYYSAGNVGAILSSRLPGKKTLFLMETLRKIHGESFEPKDIERIYVRALGAGTLKAGFYVMVGTSRGIFDFALLLPQSEDDDDHVPIGFLLKGELEVLEKSAQRDPELGIRSGAYLPPKGTNPGALSVSYGGRDLEKMLQNNDEQILQSARLAFLENAISRYIRNMFRMGGYHMVSDFKPANTAHLDLTVRIIDYGIHFYSEKIAQVTFMINTLVEGKSVLGKEWSYPPETDDRQYIFSGILKTFTGSHKPSDADYAYYLGQGLDFLRQIYSDPDGALTPASKKELEKFFRNVGKIEVTDMFTPLATTVSEGDFEAVAREAAASNAKEKRPIRFPDVRNLSLKGQDLSYARLAQRSGVSVPSDSEKMPVGDVIRVLDYISQDYAILPDEIVLDVLAAWARRFRVKMPELKSRDHYRALIRTLRESAEAVSASGRTSVERSVTVKDEDRDFYHELSSFQIQKIFERFSGQDEDKISSAELAMMPYSLEFVLLDVLKSRQKEFNPALSAAYKAALKKQQAISLLVPDGTSSSPDSPIASSRKKARSEMREEDIAEAQREISDRAEVTDRAANANAGEYDLPGQYAVSENLKMFVAGLKEHYSGHLSSLKALDLATGTGSVAFAMASAGVGTITALDINEGMLKRAQRSSSASPKVVFLQGDIFNARQVLERAGRDTIFDLITIGYTLHAYKPEDITELLATARTMLSEGGRLAILGRGLDEIYNRRTMSDYRRILQKAGFDLMTVEGSNHFTLWASSRSEEPISGELKLGRESRRRTNKLPVHARAEVRAERASIKEELSDFRRRLKAIGDLPEGVLYPNSDASYQMVRNGIVPVITAGSRVLEIGTGSGVVLDLLADAGRNLAGLHFVGTDKNPAAVRTARRMLQRFGNVEIREGSLFDPVIGEKFDVIFWNPPWFDGQWKDEEAGADMVDEDYRTVRRFLEEAPAHLTANGRIFILFPVKYFPKLKSPYPFTLRDSYTNGKNLKIGLFEYDPMASRRSGFSELPKTKRTTFDAGHERRSEVRLKEVSDGLEGKIGALMSDFGNREDLRGYILSDDFPKVLQSMFGEFADTAVLLRNIRLFVSGIELPAEAETNPEIVRILPSAMAKLIQSLSVIKDHSYTIGVEAPSSGEKTVFMEQLLSVLSQRAGLVNEIAVAGRLDGEGQSSLRKLEIVVRPVIPNRPFIARNNQTAVPMVVSSAEAEISSFNAIFHPIMSEADGMTDPFVREYTDLLKVVAAIHLAELTTRNSKLLNQPQLLRAELFKSLNIAERAELQNLIQMNTSGRGFTISSVAVKIFLEMQAREAILRAA